MSDVTYKAMLRSRTSRIALHAGLVLGAALLVSAVGGSVGRARAADDVETIGVETAARQFREVTAQLQKARGDLGVARLQLERANAVLGYSEQYQIPADLAAAIYDVALSEGLDPSLGFRLVKVESSFKRGARSNKSAIGYTQIQVPTARYYERGITEEQLYDRETNLRLGFRFLNDLLRNYDGDMSLALLAYNRGPARVSQILSEGGDPANGYAKSVLKGYHRTLAR